MSDFSEARQVWNDHHAPLDEPDFGEHAVQIPYHPLIERGRWLRMVLATCKDEGVGIMPSVLFTR